MSSIWSKLINLAGNVTGTLGVGNGGTGASTLTSNGVLLGNGTSAISAVTGTTSQVLIGGSGPTFGNVPAAAIPAAVNGTTAGGLAASGVPGNVTGTAVAAGYVGEMPVGSQRSGSDGYTYSLQSTTAPTSSGAGALISTTGVLQKGIYLVSISSSGNASLSTGYFLAYVRIGGTIATLGQVSSVSTNGYAVGLSFTLPVVITSNNVSVDLYGELDTGTGSNWDNEMWIIRID